MVFAGIDLSQTGLALVTATPEVIASLDWGRVEHVTIGESLEKSASARQRAERLVKLRRAAIAWLRRRSPTEVWFEGYPMGRGDLFGIQVVAEMGGSLRDALLTEFGLAAESSPISSARSLFLGSLSKARLAAATQRLTKAQLRSMGIQKSAIWCEAQRMGCGLDTPDEADALVALNYGLHSRGLQCLTQ